MPIGLTPLLPSSFPWGGGGGGGGRALLEGEGGHRGSHGAVAERSRACESGLGGGGYWRLEMRLGLVLGYGNAVGIEAVQWGGGRGESPLPFKRFPGGGGGGQWCRVVERSAGAQGRCEAVPSLGPPGA